MSAILNTIYNNYLSNYTPKNATRYEAHKKSDLQNVYNSIIKINNASPWYLPTTNEDTKNYVVGIKETVRNLQNEVASLSGYDETNLLSQKIASSTNPEIVTAAYIGSPTSDGTTSSFSIEVEQLASAQENMGKFFQNSPVLLAEGEYSFDISIHDMNYEFQFSISEEETNKEVQSRLARLIDNSGIGLKSSLLEENGKTALLIRSESTGLVNDSEQIFNISDDNTSKTSGAVAYLGLDYISHPATNASFKINGEERTSNSNQFTIGKLYQLQLNGISQEGTEVTIGLKNDSESLKENIVHLTDNYNDFINSISSYSSSQSRNKLLLNEMKSLTQMFHESFDSMGIETLEDGSIEINQELLSQTIEDTELFSDTANIFKDFAQTVLKKSSQITLNPMNYVEKTIVAYKNPGRNTSSPYVTSAYSGMLFSGYC